MADEIHGAKGFEEDIPPEVKYITDHSTKVPAAVRRLETWGLNNAEEYYMMGATEVINYLMMTVKMIRAKKTLDIGVYTGNSALAVAMALPPDGKVTALDVTDEFMGKGLQLMEEMGVRKKVELHIRPALDTLDELLRSGQAGTFDFAFIDADKENYTNYYERCVRLLRTGGVICVDNAMWGNSVLKPEDEMDEETRGVHEFNKRASGDPRVHCSLLQLGDGLHVCLKL